MRSMIILSFQTHINWVIEAAINDSVNRQTSLDVRANSLSYLTSHCHCDIRYFLMLVATGSFSPERGLPVNFCVDFNHFQSIVMSALVHGKTLECSFLNNFRLIYF